jgi:hypothetical protein
MKKKVIALNVDKGGCCRTIKAQYYKNNVTNLLSSGSFGATGVLVVYEED